MRATTDDAAAKFEAEFAARAIARHKCTHRWKLVSLSAFHRTHECEICGALFASAALIHIDEDGSEARAWPPPPGS